MNSNQEYVVKNEELNPTNNNNVNTSGISRDADRYRQRFDQFRKHHNDSSDIYNRTQPIINQQIHSETVKYLKDGRVNGTKSKGQKPRAPKRPRNLQNSQNVAGNNANHSVNNNNNTTNPAVVAQSNLVEQGPMQAQTQPQMNAYPPRLQQPMHIQQHQQAPHQAQQQLLPPQNHLHSQQQPPHARQGPQPMQTQHIKGPHQHPPQQVYQNPQPQPQQPVTHMQQQQHLDQNHYISMHHGPQQSQQTYIQQHPPPLPQQHQLFQQHSQMNGTHHNAHPMTNGHPSHQPNNRHQHQQRQVPQPHKHVMMSHSQQHYQNHVNHLSTFTALPNDLDLNLQAGLECDIDSLINHEISVEGNLDFNYDLLSRLDNPYPMNNHQ